MVDWIYFDVNWQHHDIIFLVGWMEFKTGNKLWLPLVFCLTGIYGKCESVQGVGQGQVKVLTFVFVRCDSIRIPRDLRCDKMLLRIRILTVLSA